MVCTFFGHRTCPQEIESILRSQIINLIEKNSVNKFYVGNQGEFDFLVHKILKELVQTYDIEYAVVLAYMPRKKYEFENQIPNDTLLPEGIESVHPKFAISWRNEWMVKQANYVVTYVKYSHGGAAKFKKLAEQQKKIVIKLI